MALKSERNERRLKSVAGFPSAVGVLAGKVLPQPFLTPHPALPSHSLEPCFPGAWTPTVFLFHCQLEIFLTQRAVEMSEEADILAMSQFQLAPAILQGQTKEQMVTMVATLQDLIGRLTNLRMQHLFMILASPRSGRLWAQCSAILSSSASLAFLFSLRYPLSTFPASRDIIFTWGWEFSGAIRTGFST